MVIVEGVADDLARSHDHPGDSSRRHLMDIHPLHRGKRTGVWQTQVTDEAGRLRSLTIQTQMVLVQ
jgi:hypothetical protein